eukprot:TRINITY_DN32320_c0_g1_i1.p1 TRINITY_DN32320_c0_g1~~TRINITY_DN32320_c0_g1_i1.p1  ORF type:complete len:1209 (+),score=292.27 TRINITY_DN32320_c0_g1_i1:61-3627(+)
MAARKTYASGAGGYQLLEPVGVGGWGRVWRAVCRDDGEEVAVKVINLDKVDATLDHLMREAATMRSCLHPNVLQMCASFVAGDDVWLVSEYHSYGSVADVIRAAGSDGLWTQEPVCVAVLAQAAAGLAYVHSHGQAHRDIKASNLLVARDGRICIADFGIATPAECRGRRVRGAWAGSPCWMAPEMMAAGSEADVTKQDVWALGITALEVACGKPPYVDKPPMKVFSLVVRNSPPTAVCLNVHAARALSQAYHSFVARCLTKDPEARPTSAEMLGDPLLGSEHRQEGHVTVVRQWLRAASPPQLTSVPLNAGTSGQGPERPEEWTFPPTPPLRPHSPELPPAGAWLEDAIHLAHRSSMAAYRIIAPPVGSGRLKRYAATARDSDTPVTLHEAEIGTAAADPHATLLGSVQTHDAVDMLLALSDPTILSCHELWEDGAGRLYWVTDRLPAQTLSQEIAASPSGASARGWASDVANALAVLHDRGLTHRHLHADLCYATTSGRVLVDAVTPLLLEAAAERARDISPSPSSTDSCPHGWRFLAAPGGTPLRYAPPEVIGETCRQTGEGLQRLHKNWDVYQFGLLCLHMFTRALPYGDIASDADMAAAKKQKPASLVAETDSHPDWRELILQCIGAAEQRPTAQRLLQNPLLAGSRTSGAPRPRPAARRPSAAHVVQPAPVLVGSSRQPTEDTPPAMDQCATMAAAMCPSCLRSPTDPRLLDCGHSVCLGCAKRGHKFTTSIHNLLKQTSGWAFGEPGRCFVCPLCGRATALPAHSPVKDAADIDGDEAPEGLLHALPKGAELVPVCDHCEKAGAELECAQCAVALCRPCSNDLHQRGRFRAHVVTELPSTSLPQRPQVDDPGRLTEQLRERLGDITAAERLISQQAERLAADADTAETATKDLFTKAAEALARRQRQVIRRLREGVSERLSVARQQVGLLRQLHQSIELALATPAPASPIAVCRFTSLLAMPCPAEPQQGVIRVAIGEGQLARQPISRIAQVQLQASPLVWKASASPSADNWSYPVVAVAAAVAAAVATPQPVAEVVPKSARVLRLVPEGLQPEGSWIVRQLLVFDATGTNIAVDPLRCRTSGCADEYTQGAQALPGWTGRSPAGKWAAPVRSGDSSWIEYDLPLPVPELAMVVVRSYPGSFHSPQRVRLVGFAEDGSCEVLQEEEVTPASAASWDCMLML